MADAGFDSIKIWSKAKGKGLKPIIPLKGGEVRDKLRNEGKRGFDPFLYRLRGVAEGAFGGIKTRLNGCFREIREDISIKMAFLEGICYNLRIYLSFFFVFILAPFGFALKR